MSATTSPVPSRRSHERRYAGLGARRIWWGVIVLVGIQMVFDLGQTIGELAHTVRPELVVTAWGVLIVADAAVMIVTRVLGDHLPNWMFGIFVGALAVCLLLDLGASWGQPQFDFVISVGRSATFSLLLALPTRPGLEIVLATLGFTFLTTLAMAFDGVLGPAMLASSLFTLCQMCLTVVVAVVAMAGFRELVGREIEQVRSRAAVLAPRLTVGIDQSEQLARLDLAAESLLAAVAEGRIQLPLNEDIARRAGSLATELRMHLLESRNRTWLDLAIEESELLAAAVQVEDPSTSAGLLAPRQRGALLSALWLLTDEQPARRAGQPATLVAIHRPVPAGGSSSAVPIVVQLSQRRRSGLDAGVWEHFAKVGDYREFHESGVVRIEIRAIVPVGGPRTGGTR